MPTQPPGENFHFVGFTQNFNPTSPPPQPPCFKQSGPKEKVTEDVVGDEGVEASMAVKKRYWTHDEEVRLVIIFSRSF